ncbi:MAG: dihydropteroate synthase [Rhodospirillales bacterium]|nr:dihydropteroate synthase [Rhodospirillales bacterium]
MRATPIAATWAGLSLDRPRLMAILNVTPDSFSDPGAHADPASAIAAGRAMLEAGADILDIGGESTRPGADPVAPEEEIRRVLPAIRALAATGAPLSIDTRHAATMAAALDAGARIVNDVSGLTHDPDSARLVAARGAPVVLMHSRGTPQSMQGLASYADVASEVVAELRARMAAAEAAGVARAAICLDPGFGFAKRPAHSTELLRRLPELAALGRPLLVGVSRKGFIGRLSGAAAAADRLAGSLAAGLFALSRGAAILRVHDIAATAQAVTVWQALAG